MLHHKFKNLRESSDERGENSRLSPRTVWGAYSRSRLLKDHQVATPQATESEITGDVQTIQELLEEA